MKKLLLLPLMLVAVFAFAPVNAVASNSANVSSSAQPRRNRAYYSQPRTRTYTRNVRVGRRTFRETYRVTTRRNGRVVTQLISRTRIR